MSPALTANRIVAPPSRLRYPPIRSRREPARVHNQLSLFILAAFLPNATLLVTLLAHAGLSFRILFFGLRVLHQVVVAEFADC